MTEQHNTEYQDRRTPAEQSWHLKKEINVSIIISVLGIAIAVVTGYSDLKKDIELIKAEQVVLRDRDDQQVDDGERALSLIRASYERLEAKLDRLIERGQK